MASQSLERYYPYLTEIKRRLLLSAVVFVVASAVGFIYYDRVVLFILRLFSFNGVNVVFTSPFQFVSLAINSAMLVGFAVAFPLFLTQLMLFLKPALKKKEFSILISFVPLSIILFVVGFGFGIVVMRYVISLFHEKAVAFEVGNFLDISLLLSQTMITAFLMGVGFQFPVVLSILLKLKLISKDSLARHRLMAYGLSVVFAALLPPTDILSLLLLTMPLVILFEFTLILNKFVFR